MLQYETTLASGLADLALRIGVAANNIELEGTYGAIEPLQNRFELLQRAAVDHTELSQTVQGLRDGQKIDDDKIVETLIETEGRIWGALAARNSLPQDQRERLQRLVSGQGTFSMIEVLEAHRWIRTPFLRGLLAPDEKLESEIKTTPLFPFPKLSKDGRQVFVKLEGRQRSGSLKVRGSTYVLAAARILGRNPYQTRVVTASAGNLVFGLMAAARNLGFLNVEVALPKSVSPEKEARLRKLGATVNRMSCETLEQAEELTRYAVEGNPDVLYVSRFDNPMLAMGLGTLAVEIEIQMSRKKGFRQYAVVAPAGTGGLLAGLGTYLESQNIPVFGVQSEAYSNLTESFRQKRPLSAPPGLHKETLADSIAVHTVGPKIFGAVQRTVTAMTAVPEDRISEAVAYMDDVGFVCEGAAALAVAAVLSGAFNQYLPPNMPIVIVQTGENVDQLLHDETVRKGHHSQEMRDLNNVHERTTRPAPAESKFPPRQS